MIDWTRWGAFPGNPYNQLAGRRFDVYHVGDGGSGRVLTVASQLNVCGTAQLAVWMKLGREEI